MIQGIPKSTPYVDMRCTISMAKVTSQELIVQNNIQTRVTATASTDYRGWMCTYSYKSPCTDTQTHVSISKYARGSTCTEDRVTCMEDCVSACTDVPTDITGVHGSTCPYISTKGMGVHGVTYTENFTVNTFICGRRNVYD